MATHLTMPTHAHHKYVEISEYGQNYVDRIRLEEDTFQNHKNPNKSLGWRHNNSISHLDLATSCHNFASSLNSWHPLCLTRHQLRHSRSLDYNHIDRCKDALDIADYYLYINSDAKKYEEEFEPTSVDVNFVSGRHLVQQSDHRGYKYPSSENKYHHSPNNTYQATQKPNQSQSMNLAIPAGFEFSNDSCSLRRSRSLAVIREETYNDLQIPPSINNCRRSQLIPRAHLVNRAIFREHDRLIFSNNKQYQNHMPQEKLGNENTNVTQEPDAEKNEDVFNKCDAHQQKTHLAQCVLYDQCQHCRGSQLATIATDTYYDNLKRLDGLCDQIHPWHSEKSDLESLNSDYFKNSLHQPKELQQRIDFDVIEKNYSTNEKPRIYQSRRQHLQHCITDRLHHKLTAAVGASGGESCRDNSQSSIFPESTPSISDDQSDSASLSEQEYDITKVEKLFKRKQSEMDKSYELFNLISGNHNFNTTDDIDKQYRSHEQNNDEYIATNQLNKNNTKDADATYTDLVTVTDLNIENYSTLSSKQQQTENFQKIIAYDSVYLSSEEGSESTLVGKACDNSLDAISLKTCLNDMKALLHISIEDPLYELNANKLKVQIESKECEINTPKEISEKKTQNCMALKSRSTTEIDCNEDWETYNNQSNLIHTQVSNFTILHNNQNDNEYNSAYNTLSDSPNLGNKSSLVSLVESSKGTHIASSVEFDTKAIIPYNNVTDSNKEFISSKYKFRGNQYCSLPDVNISQSLHVSESIDAQLRFSYNSDNYNSSNGNGSDNFSNRNDDNSNDSVTEVQEDTRTEKEETIIIEEIYDSIKRCKKDFRSDSKISESGNRQNGYEYHPNLDNIAIVNPENSVNLTTNEACHERMQLRNSLSTPEITEEIIENSTNEQCHVTTATESFDCFEKPKEVLTIEVENFSKQIEQKAKEIRESYCRNKLSYKEIANGNKLQTESNYIYETLFKKETSLTNPGTRTPLRIIVTDVQSNIIEEDSIDATFSEIQSQTTRENQFQQNTNKANCIKSLKQTDTQIPNVPISDQAVKLKSKIIKSNIMQLGGENVKSSCKNVSTLRRMYSKHKRQHSHLNSFYHKENCESKRLSVSPKPKKSILNSQIYRARPVKVLSLREPQNPIDSKLSTPAIKTIVNIFEKEQNITEGINDVPTINQDYVNEQKSNHPDWNILNNSKNRSRYDNSEIISKTIKQSSEELKFNSNWDHNKSQSHESQEGFSKVLPSNNGCPANDDFSSFLPSVEIVELEGNKKATIVSTVTSNDLADVTTSNQTFDHIRYKVLKPQQLLRGAHLTRSKKAAQFEGLIQYLQEYSFQELLSNNNVVIVEPVRTKIEQPLQATSSCLTMPPINAINSPLKKNQTRMQTNINNDGINKQMLRDNKISSGIKRHFFYQPVRVNRELHENELPNPDTVRNVCKFFEEHVLTTPNENFIASNTANTSIKSNKTAIEQMSSAARRARKQRYLTIDAPYDHMLPTKNNYDFVSTNQWENTTPTNANSISSVDLSSQLESTEVDTYSVQKKSGKIKHRNQSDEILKVHVQDIIRKHNCAALISTNNVTNNYNNDNHNSLDDNILSNNTINDSLHKWNNKNQGDFGDTYRELYNDDNNNENSEKFSECHYVSNDVLKKIRQYGSSVTYYGGRVVQSNNYQQHIEVDNSQDRCAAEAYAVLIPLQLSLQTNTETQSNGTRAIHFVDGISTLKSTNAESMDPNSAKILHKVFNNERKQLFNCNVCDKDNDKGIMFKLVKSNSCNSRLELEGALNSNLNESEIVRKMVHKFEEENKLAAASTATLSNQMKSALKSISNPRCNEILSHPLIVKNTSTLSHIEDRKNCNSANNYQISCTKLCRNKNVDLAFTLAKQYQVQNNSAAHPRLQNIKPDLANLMDSCEEETKNVKMQSFETHQILEKTSTNNHIKFNKQETNYEEISSEAKVKPAASNCQTSSTVCTSLNGNINTLSLLDKSLVKHYVTNDKSIYNKHRFDDIKFEEFEVYDPATDFDKFAKQNILKSKKNSFKFDADNTNATDNVMKDSSSLSQSRYHNRNRCDENNSTETDSDCYDSLDDKL